MGNNTDDFSGPAKSTEVNDQAVGQMHDFGSCKIVDGKSMLTNEITAQCVGLGSSTVGPASEFPGQMSGSQDAKVDANMSKGSNDPATPGGLDEEDGK